MKNGFLKYRVFFKVLTFLKSYISSNFQLTFILKSAIEITRVAITDELNGVYKSVLAKKLFQNSGPNKELE